MGLTVVVWPLVYVTCVEFATHYLSSCDEFVRPGCRISLPCLRDGHSRSLPVLGLSWI